AARADGRQRNLIARRRETGAAENVAGHDEDGARQRRLLQKRPASEGASVFSLHGRDSVWWMGSSQTVPHFALTGNLKRRVRSPNLNGGRYTGSLAGHDAHEVHPGRGRLRNPLDIVPARSLVGIHKASDASPAHVIHLDTHVLRLRN